MASGFIIYVNKPTLLGLSIQTHSARREDLKFVYKVADRR